ncbi:hypothetical protein FACS18942_08750 [Planctomycetales bacterium]|nr:hypothetical protein FACS18942_08750 [Planctomycetales bacterium]
MTEKPFLKTFFETFGADIQQVPWDKLKRNDIDLLLKLFDDLPPDKRDEAEVVLRHVHALSCEQGVQALGEAADELHADESWADVYLSEKNLYTKAMSAWLTHREIFDRAVRFYEMDSLSWWRKRADLPKITPTFDETVKENLEDELEQFFSTKQGRGFVCTAEMFARSNGTYYFYAYPDDYVEDALVHNESGDLVPQTIRKTFELVFAYDSVEGTSDLCAKVPKKLKEELEAIFLNCIFAISLQKEEGHTFNLAMLLNPDFTLHTRPEHHVKARVVSLTLALANKDEITFISKRLHTASEMAMGSIKLTPSIKDAVVKKAKFRFEFLNPETKKTKTLTFDVGVPLSCSLKNKQPNLIETVHHYLKEWRIENAADRLSLTASDIPNAARPFVGQRTSIGSNVPPALVDSKTY